VGLQTGGKNKLWGRTKETEKRGKRKKGGGNEKRKPPLGTGGGRGENRVEKEKVR